MKRSYKECLAIGRLKCAEGTLVTVGSRCLMLVEKLGCRGLAGVVGIRAEVASKFTGVTSTGIDVTSTGIEAVSTGIEAASNGVEAASQFTGAASIGAVPANKFAVGFGTVIVSKGPE
jgi:hypothetical protein